MFDLFQNFFHSFFNFFAVLIGGNKAANNPADFWAFMAGLWTFILALVAYLQLSRTNKISSVEFIHKLKNDFFTDKTRILIFLIVNDLLKFVEKDDEGNDLNNPYFNFDISELEQGIGVDFVANLKRVFCYEKKIFTCFEIDDLLLGHFEDLGIFEQQGVIIIDMAYEEFDYYLDISWKNCAIQEYIQMQRRDDGYDIYGKFEYIYEKSRSFGKAKEKAWFMWLWQLRWFLKPPF